MSTRFNKRSNEPSLLSTQAKTLLRKEPNNEKCRKQTAAATKRYYITTDNGSYFHADITENCQYDNG